MHIPQCCTSYSRKGTSLLFAQKRRMVYICCPKRLSAFLKILYHLYGCFPLSSLILYFPEIRRCILCFLYLFVTVQTNCPFTCRSLPYTYVYNINHIFRQHNDPLYPSDIMILPAKEIHLYTHQNQYDRIHYIFHIKCHWTDRCCQAKYQ